MDAVKAQFVESRQIKPEQNKSNHELQTMKTYDVRQKTNRTPLAAVRSIKSVTAAREYLGLNQTQLARLIAVDPAVVSKVENNHARLSGPQVERLSIEVARKFRDDSWRVGQAQVGLKYFYNSPLRFEAWAVCYQHRRPIEYQVKRLTDACPMCKRKVAK